MTDGIGPTRIASIAVHLLTLELRAEFTTSFGTYRTLTRPFVVVRDDDGVGGVGEIPTLADPAYKPEADTPAALTSLKEFVLPSVARHQAAHGSVADVEALRASFAWVKGAAFAKSGVEAGRCGTSWHSELGSPCGGSGAAPRAPFPSASASAPKRSTGSWRWRRARSVRASGA